MPARPRAILTDIEGTTSPIAFVHDVLFPYARARLAGFIDQRADDPAVIDILSQVHGANGGQPALPTLLAWMDQDAKTGPLKALQGLIWEDGYRSGELVGRLYPDVAPALHRWRACGLSLHVYSSGSEAAQRNVFGHSEDGNLAGLFDGFFDTRVGPKREPASYARIASMCGAEPPAVLFLSDVEQELDAAASAGLSVCQLVRPADGTVASLRHPTAPDFATIAARLERGSDTL